MDILTFEKNEKLYNGDQFLPYMLFNDEIKKATANYEGYKPIDYQLPLIRYYGKKEAIKNALKLFMWPTSDPILRVKGYSPKDSAWNSDFDKAKGKMEFYYVKLDTAIITLFENFLNECKTEKVKIIFVYIPEYIERRTFIKNRDEIFSVFAMFSKKYNIPFYDYSNDTISFHKKYFYNASHLNKTGAELFTSKLAQKLKSNNAHHPN